MQPIDFSPLVNPAVHGFSGLALGIIGWTAFYASFKLRDHAIYLMPAGAVGVCIGAYMFFRAVNLI